MAKLSECNNLEARNSKLAEEWHPIKNGDLRPNEVTPKSNKKVWWCCKNGHEWETSANERSSGKGCPFCSGHRPTKENNLEVKDEQLAKEWHPTKNVDLRPNGVAPKSNKKVWWICEKGHEWETKINDRARGAGCPYCSGKYASKENNLENDIVLAKQWHPTKNGELKPHNITRFANRKVWWLCKNGHEWEAAVNNRSQGRGCPFCSYHLPTKDNNLLVCFPNIANQWHPTKNGTIHPEDVTVGSDKKVWWKCELGHEWVAYIYSRTGGNKNGCPYCSGREPTDTNNLEFVNPKLALQWHPTKNGMIKPKDVLPYSNKKIWWQCEKGHEWEAIINSRAQGRGCPYCSKIVSKGCVLWLDTLSVKKREHPIRIGNKRYVADGTDLSIKTVFEFLGDYWHGNPSRYNPKEINVVTKCTFGELFDKTLRKFTNLHSNGYVVIYRWESSQTVFQFDGMLRY